MKSETKKRIGMIVLFCMVFTIFYSLLLVATGQSGCIKEKHIFRGQEIRKDEECQTKDKRCLFIETKRCHGPTFQGYDCRDNQTYYFAEDKELLDFESGDEILIRWCDIKPFSPDVERRIRGVSFLK